MLTNIEIRRLDARVDARGISAQLRPLLGKSALLICAECAEDRLQQAFPDLLHISVTRQLPSTLQVEAASRPAALRWLCQDSQEKATSVLVNSLGRVIAPLSEAESVGSFPLYEQLPGEECPRPLRGSVLIAPSLIAALERARTSLGTAIGQPITSARYFRVARELHLVAGTTAFWLDFQTPLSDQLQKLDTALPLEPALRQAPEYIDLRVPGKIFFQPS